MKYLSSLAARLDKKKMAIAAASQSKNPFSLMQLTDVITLRECTQRRRLDAATGIAFPGEDNRVAPR